MTVSMVLGALVGALAASPLFISSKLSVNVVNSSHFSYTSLLLLALFASLLILAVPVIICAFVARGDLLSFAIAEVAVYFVGIIAFGILAARRR